MHVYPELRYVYLAGYLDMFASFLNIIRYYMSINYNISAIVAGVCISGLWVALDPLGDKLFAYAYMIYVFLWTLLISEFENDHTNILGKQELTKTKY
jgi:hypothetical protein